MKAEKDKGDSTSSKSKMLTPPKIAKDLAVRSGKVLGWIRSGELLAINLAERPTGRPRYRVKPSDLEAFLNRRTMLPLSRGSSRRASVSVVTVGTGTMDNQLRGLRLL
jgi:hypothetical protein